MRRIELRSLLNSRLPLQGGVADRSKAIHQTGQSQRIVNRSRRAVAKLLREGGYDASKSEMRMLTLCAWRGGKRLNGEMPPLTPTGQQCPTPASPLSPEPTPSGYSLHHELELYVRAGIPAPEVLRMATLTRSQVMGETKDLGIIAAGKLAGMILIDGDPAKNICDTRNITTVIKVEKMYDQPAIEKALGIAPRPAQR